MKTSTARIAALLFAAALGALLAYPIQALWWKGIAGLMGPLAPVAPEAATILGFLLLGAFGVAVLRWLRPRWTHFRETFLYPPVLLAGVMGYVAFVALFSIWSKADTLERIILSCPLIVLGISVSIVCRDARRRSPVAQSVPMVAGSASNDEIKLATWLSGEDPIRDSSLDLANMGRKAARLSLFLQQRRDGAEALARTLAIRGSFGSGKTSLTLLIEKESAAIQNEIRLIFARTNCWGFEDASRAQEHILRSCVERLNEFVDTTALRSLPKHYVEAIGETPFKPFGILLSGTAEPIDLLQQFSPLLGAINARLVVVIEDLDRAGEDFDQTQIFALLHRLRHIERISFILTTGGRTPVELHKVAEHVEFLDDLSTDVARSVIQSVRAAVRATDFIDPQSFVEKHYPQKQRFDDFKNDGSHYWPPHVAALLSNLRVLKFALRDYRSRWSELCGEVDCDELLMLLALRHGAPPAYEFLMENSRDILGLRNFGFGDFGRDDYQRRVATLKRDWEVIAATNSFNVEAAAAVLHELFPGIGAVVGDVGRSYGIRVQSVRGDREQIYLNRIHAGEIDSDVVRDQLALARLRDVAKSPAGMDHLLEGIRQISDFAELIRFFQKELNLLSEAQQFEIVGKLIEGARVQLGVRARIMATELCGMEDWIERQGGDTDQQRDWFIAQIRLSLPTSMTLASHLLGRAMRNASLVHSGGAAIVGATCERIAALSVTEFVNSLDPEVPHSLQWIFNEWRQVQATQWTPVVALLLSAMRASPDVMYPAALIFILQGQDPVHERDRIVDVRVRAVMREHARVYYSLIVEGSAPPNVLTSHWAALQATARILLQELTPATPVLSSAPIFRATHA